MMVQQRYVNHLVSHQREYAVLDVLIKGVINVFQPSVLPVELRKLLQQGGLLINTGCHGVGIISMPGEEEQLINNIRVPVCFNYFQQVSPEL
ncbi:MAG: hypothetical protein BWY89_00850 [Bacteroidetes bacterium ADurb.BinA012]|nr:MAG: hypothetical protein BWY89_00850 [Bacteroidetes bacterium ADurb.BinA012]